MIARVKFAATLIALLIASPAFAKIVPVTWVQSTQNDDGTTLAASQITGNRVAWGTCSGSTFTKTGERAGGARTSDAIDLPAGTWCVMVTTSSAKGESPLSNPAYVTVAADPVCPGAPALESRQQTCPAPGIGSYTQTHGWTSAPAPTCWTADAWAPATPPAGVCAIPQLLTTGPLAYELRGSTMGAIGLVPVGIGCGPKTQVVAGVKYCEVQRLQVDIVNWPTDLKVPTLWGRTQ